MDILTLTLVVAAIWLVYIAAGMTALTWLLMPLVKFDQIEESASSSAGIPRDAAT